MISLCHGHPDPPERAFVSRDSPSIHDVTLPPGNWAVIVSDVIGENAY